MPADFKLSTEEKIDLLLAEDPSIAKDREKLAFFSSIYGKIDDILQSGYVTYGDEITEYVKSVAAKILENDPSTFAKLRFYTVQSTETNALSTQQGIIFVTTGLISQLVNEAQLAYVLAHEISHYTENHILESYEWRKQNRKGSTYSQLANYSKEHELEADRKAVDLYKNAGYSFDELVNTFDVLMYSYLPFDEIAVKKEFYNIPKIYFGDEKFATKEYLITAVEDYNDELSSHPNIKTRKEETLKAAEGLSDWGTTVQHLSINKFKQVRSIARFESLRIEQMNHHFARALYLVFLLEKDFPKSAHIQEMKAFSWYGLGAYYDAGKKTSTVPRLKTAEGESAKMFHFLNELKRDELNALALRNIYEVYKADTSNKFVLKIIQEFANGNETRWAKQMSELKAISFDEATKREQFSKDSLSTIVQPVVVETETNSKYDRIKTKKTTQSNALDSTTCFKYGFADILNDSIFIAYFPKKTSSTSFKETEKENAETETEVVDNDEVITKTFLKETGVVDEKSLADFGKLYIVDPSVSVNIGTSEKSQMILDKVVTYNEEALTNSATDAGIDITLISSKEIREEGSTSNFNDRNLMVSFIEQQNVSDEINIVPVDFTSISDLKSRKGIENVCFSLITHYKNELLISPMTYFTCIFLILPAPIMIPILIFDAANRKVTDYSFLVMDLEKGETVYVNTVLDHSKPTKLNVQNYYYHLFKSKK